MRVSEQLGRIASIALYPSVEPRAVRAAEQAAAWLQRHGVRAYVVEEFVAASGVVPTGCEVVSRPPACELAVALGGDGTLLKTARWVADAGIPVLGINLGTLGFLSAYSGDEVTQALEDAVGGKLVWEPRIRVAVGVERAGKIVHRAVACNDCYFKHGASPRMLDLRTEVGGSEMAQFRADGLVISTPMGSTAYNLASGGPIVDAGTRTLVITPICPHSLTHRPVVIAADDEVRVRVDGPSRDCDATLSVDGQWSVPLAVDDVVVVTLAHMVLKLVPPRATVFEVLRHKFGWSEREFRGLS